MKCLLSYFFPCFVTFTIFIGTFCFPISSLFLVKQHWIVKLRLSFRWLSGQFLDNFWPEYWFQSIKVISLADWTLVNEIILEAPVFFFGESSFFFFVYYYFFSKTNVLTPFSASFYPSLYIRPEIITNFGRNWREEFSGKVLSVVFEGFASKGTG